MAVEFAHACTYESVIAPIAPIEYVEARRTLLDALDALRPHIDALVLVGAQAVYLRSEGRLAGYQAFTTDADLVVDPAKLGPDPPLGQAMESAGFVLSAEPGIWEARINRPGVRDAIIVPIDLIVPEQFAVPAGRRAARLPGAHGKSTARKSAGLEGVVVDNNPINIAALQTFCRSACCASTVRGVHHSPRPRHHRCGFHRA